MTAIQLLSGNMCDERLWSQLRPALEDAGHNVATTAFRDQGTIDDMAQHVLAQAPHRFVAIGFSMGAIVALEVARRSPERVAALGLIAVNAAADLPERAAVRPRQQADAIAGRLAHVVAEELKPNYLADANRGDVELLRLTMSMALDLGAEVFVRQSEALRMRRDLRPVLGHLTMPVLLLCGQEDALCPPAWHHLWAEQIGPGAEVQVIPDAGHLLPLEQPLASAALLNEWLERTRNAQ